MSVFIRYAVAVAAFFFVSVSASAQLEIYKDYDLSESVWILTTVKVDANRGDDYLEGIRKTWAAANQVAKDLGQIEDYGVMVSDLPSSGEFNMILGIKLATSADMQPNKEDYDAFMDAWGKANRDKTREVVKNYPGMRTITGTYMMREVTFK